MHKSLSKWGIYALFVAPVICVFFIVVVIPFFMGIYYSFFSWDGMNLNPKVFLGLQNYADVFTDLGFWQSAGHTVFFTIISTLLINAVGLCFALAVTSKLRLKNASRAMLFMPYLIGGLILGYIWKFIFEDVLTAFGEWTGLTEMFFDWVNNSQMAVDALIAVMTWQMAGYIMIIYITGLQSIPEELIEASYVDGSNYWQTLFKIKFPLLMPSFTICLFLTLANCFKVYDINFSLTGGGPAKASELFAMNIFNEIFKMSHFGYGQAKAVLFFFVVAAITIVQVSYTKKREVTM